MSYSEKIVGVLSSFGYIYEPISKNLMTNISWRIRRANIRISTDR